MDRSFFRRVLPFGVAICFFWSCTSDLSSDGNLFGIELERFRLSNGLTVLLVEDHRVPLVSYQSWYKVGSVDERLGIRGISHLFEHLMFKGTEKYGPKSFFKLLEIRGAEVNAYTTRDYTVFYQNFVPELLEQVVDMEADRLKNLKLDEPSLRVERQVVFEERRLRTDNSPYGKMQEALWELAYTRHPYRWPVIGYPEDLLLMKTKDLNEHFQKYYRPNHLTIVVVGAIKKNRLRRLIEKAYGDIPKGKEISRKVEAEPRQKSERRIELRDEVAAEQFLHGYHVSEAGHEDSYALDVLSNILFFGASSRVYKELVEKQDLVKVISGIAFTPTFPGLFMINATMKNGLKSEVAEAELDKVFYQVQTKGVSKQEVEVAVRQLKVELLSSIQTHFGLGQLIGTYEMVLGNAENFTDDLAHYLKVTEKDVKRVANRYLYPNNRTTVTLVPNAKTAEKKR